MPVRFEYRGKQFVMDGISTDLYYRRLSAGNFKFYEEKLLLDIEALGLDGMYIDAGANCGNHSIFFANFCKCHKVVSVEPHHLAYQILEDNVKENVNPEDGCEVVIFSEVALLDKPGMTSIQLYEPHNLGGTTVKQTVEDKGTIVAMTLDELLKQPELVDERLTFLKMDVESCEKLVVLGGLETIKKHRPVLTAELKFGHEVTEFFELMKTLNYKAGKVYDKHTYMFFPEEYYG